MPMLRSHFATAEAACLHGPLVGVGSSSSSSNHTARYPVVGSASAMRSLQQQEVCGSAESAFPAHQAMRREAVENHNDLPRLSTLPGPIDLVCVPRLVFAFARWGNWNEVAPVDWSGR
jgi:hypothetical protein